LDCTIKALTQVAGVVKAAPAILVFAIGNSPRTIKVTFYNNWIIGDRARQPDARMGCPNTVINCLCQN
jgi:hypothetical protein